MKLSVIIVNYNVKFFLDQCLQSVYKALGSLAAEVIVVDNNSVDGSGQMLKERFPGVILIQNKQNLGFSKANNQALAIAKGEYVLLLNPDTLVEEDTFSLIVGYMDQTPQVGALGVKMIDGQGNFLPESKRGLPTPWVAFYKIFGLSVLFPKSKIFGQYHLTYLDKEKRQDVDVLSGAFMFIRKEVIDQIGGLDEQFFMYGEDIDLSHRIKMAGYRVVYFPDTTIIHYKGESTRKNSLNYVYLFYNAMLIFANKHFSRQVAGGLSLLIHGAIYFRAFLSMLKRMGLKIMLPVLDLLVLYFALKQFSIFWGEARFGLSGYYPELYFKKVLPGYILLWMLALLFSGGYDRSLKFRNLLTGVFSGTLLILILYALLPDGLRFSRMMILAGTVIVLGLVMINRSLIAGVHPGFAFWKSRKRNIVIVGNLEECNRIRSILLKLKLMPDQLAFVSQNESGASEFIGQVDQLEDIVRIHKINEVIFCSAVLPASVIIRQMLSFSSGDCTFRIAPANTGSIIGSNSITSAGDLFVYSLNAITHPANIRLKRTFDLGGASLVILLFPGWCWFRKRPFSVLKDTFWVWMGYRTWIGLSGDSKAGNHFRLKKGIYTVHQGFPGSDSDQDLTDRIELSYVQDYRVLRDLNIWLKAMWNDFRHKN